ncbi:MULTISPECIES: hypothetical protein [Paenibacillus]|nr:MULTISPECIES: hypothetical protein [Paenibacillus]SDF29142.1 hypothetical protein SAMN04488689_104216 [Paenibacillus sp. cl6col]
MNWGYSSPFVSELIGIPYATLDSWGRTGFFTFQRKSYTPIIF